MTSQTFTTTFYDDEDNTYEVEFWIHPGQEPRFHYDAARCVEAIPAEVEWKDVTLLSGSLVKRSIWDFAEWWQGMTPFKPLDTLKDDIRAQWEKEFDLDEYVKEQKEKAL